VPPRHAQRDAGADGLANASDHLDVAVRIDADLDLDRADTLGGDLRHLAFGLLESDEPDRMGHRDAPADRSPQQPVHRKPALPSREVIGRELDRRLGIRIALDGAVHPRMQFCDLARQRARDRRSEMPGNDLDGGAGTLPEIATELAAPVLEGGRLAPTGGARRIGHLDEDIAADRFGQPGPLVLTPRRQRNMMQLDRCDGRFGHVQAAP
jgi:hypothetical protein